ncbi:MAG: peptide chain release factor N(5)-glutamine methyltransferase, partial [Armatimonadetes bacterium]|nr:peptide chain release factor N(5)-glutamine methyltransferase [Armatimonadota bacterium]
MSDDSPRSRRARPSREALQAAARRLAEAGVESPLTEARLLLAHVLEVPLTRLDLHLASPLEPAPTARFEALVAQRAARRPLAHLTGETEFMGLRFRCDARALIPRPDSEVLVEAVVEAQRAAPTPCVLDLGTGTGCLGLSLAVLLPEARVVLTDVSSEALALARENAEALGVTDRAAFLEGRDLEPVLAAGLAEDITAVVSNPPYIAPGDVPTLPPEVAEHEPPLAWRGEGEAGLGAYEQMIPQCADSLPNVR